jgi:lysophospholipase L1-like esterase
VRVVAFRIVAARIAAALLLSALALVPGPAGAAPVHYYLALGDSLAAGYVAGQGDTDQGYADQLHATLHAYDPGLQLVKLGCDGETTSSMIAGGRCFYPAGSQLRQAEQFLSGHRGQVRYLTLDVGANDIASCYRTSGVNSSCLYRGLRTGVGNLARIVAALYAAGGDVRAAGMTYYDPFLALWLDGVFGRIGAGISIEVQQLFAGTQAAVYGAFGFGVANVFSAFDTTSLRRTVRTPYGKLPIAVANVCRLTTMCSQEDVHANPAGYRLIARAFAAALR